MNLTGYYTRRENSLGGIFCLSVPGAALVHHDDLPAAGGSVKPLSNLPRSMRGISEDPPRAWCAALTRTDTQPLEKLHLSSSNTSLMAELQHP